MQAPPAACRRRRRRQRDEALRLLRLRLADDRLERDLRELVGELLLAQEVEQRRIAVDRGLVEVAADRNPALVGDLPDVA